MIRSVSLVCSVSALLLVGAGCSASSTAPSEEPVAVEVDQGATQPEGYQCGGCLCSGEIHDGSGQLVTYTWFPTDTYCSGSPQFAFSLCKQACHDNYVTPWARTTCEDWGYSGQSIGMRTWARWNYQSGWTHDYTDHVTCSAF